MKAFVDFFLSSFLFLLTSYFLGFICLAFKNNALKSTWVNLFVKLTGGIITCLVCYSIVVTHLHTVNIVIVLISVVFFLIQKRKDNSEKVTLNRLSLALFSDLKKLLILFAFFSAFIIVQFVRNDFFNETVIYLSYVDFGLYANVAEYMNLTGIENLHPNWENTLLNNLTSSSIPYHYGDLWLEAILLKISPANSLFTYIYVLIPVLLTLIFSGFIAVMELFYEINWFYILSAFFLIFIIGVFPFKLLVFSNCLLLFPKAIFLYLFLLVAIICIVKEEWMYFYFAMAILPVFHIMFLPLVLMSGITFFTYNKLIEKERFNIHGAILLFSSFVYIIVYYLFEGESYGTLNTSNKDSFSLLFDMSYIGDSLKIIFKTVLKKLGVFYLPFFLVCVINIKHLRAMLLKEVLLRKLLVFLSVFFFLALMLYGFLHMSVESVQFVSLIIVPLLAILHLLLFVLIIKTTEISTIIKSASIVLILIHAIISFYTNLTEPNQKGNFVSKSFIEEVKKANIRNPIGAVINPVSTDLYDYTQFLNFSGVFIKLTGENRWTVSIFLPEQIVDIRTHGIKAEIADGVTTSVFYKYIQQQKHDSTFVSADNSQISFLKEYHIDYVIVGKNATVSELLQKETKRKIIDDRTGTSLLLLR